MKVEHMLKMEVKTLPSDIARRTDGTDIFISIKFKDGSYHHIKPDDDALAKELVHDAAGLVGANPHPHRVAAVANTALPVPLAAPAEAAPASLIFKNRQAIGDILCMTAAVRDYKKTFPKARVGVRTTAMHLWDNNPYIDHTFADESAIKEIGPGFGTNRSNAWNIHLIDAFRLDMQNKLGVLIDKGDVRPDIWMTEQEYKRPPIIAGPYWVIIVGGEPGWTAKQYNRWQEVVDILKGKVRLVQLGVKKQPWPALEGVANMMGATEDRNTGIRDLFNIFLHAQGSIGLVSMHMHLSAAFGNPCVVVAGAREPAWFTQYFGHQYLQTNGTLSCGLHTACWACDVEKACKSKVEDAEQRVLGLSVPRCVHIIDPEEVAAAVIRYYAGGRLEIGKKVPNKFFKNIVKEAKLFAVPVVPTATSEDEAYVKSIGMTWGGGALTDRDWVFIKKVMVDNNVKNVLEFGAGLSTLMLSRQADSVLTFETNAGWIKKIQAFSDPSKSVIKQWDGTDIGSFSGPNFDLAFVDGPSGGQSREMSTKIASLLANIVVIHDAGRVPERQWQATYLAPDFDMVAKGGHRCHLWARKGHKLLVANGGLVADGLAAAKAKEPVVLPAAGEKTAVMITTCRGYGGSERSSLHIMKMLQDQGYGVYLAPTGVVSGEYGRNIPEGVKTIEWSALAEIDSELTVFYTSDTIWNFKNEQYTEVMPKLKAKRKVMVLNYQLGGAGLVQWTIGWDLYMFLNSTKEGEFLKLSPGSATKVLAPCTPLDQFFECTPNYNDNVRLIRHSSQGDSKHPEYSNELMIEIMNEVPDAEFHLMPARSDCVEYSRIFKYKKNVPSVNEFLEKGNCFYYHLPPNYQDQGPKVIVEAMAAGLPVIADNRYGAKDRVTAETGWLINDPEEIAPLIKLIASDLSVLRTKGLAARERARAEFVPERWIEAITDVCCRRA